MKHLSICLSLLALAAGCSSGGKAVGPSGAAAVVTTDKPVQQVRSGETIETDAVQPLDAQWSIMCRTFGGPNQSNHVELAKIAKQQVVAATGMKGFYLVHEDASSSLYYGFYRWMSPNQEKDMSKDAIAAANSAKADLRKLQSFTSPYGDRLFPNAMFTPLEPVDPPAPTEWDLRNVDRAKRDEDPSKAFWALEVGIYLDSPDRKKAAVESVEALRKSGIKDAYFFPRQEH